MSKGSLFPEPRQGLPGYWCTVQAGLRAALLCIDSMRNESRRKKKKKAPTVPGRQRGARSDFPVSRKAAQMVGNISPVQWQRC